MKRLDVQGLLLLIFLAGSARAAGYEGLGVGPRALSMGGAFTGLADDWSAAYWNPGGLAFLKGAGIGVDTQILTLHVFDGNSIANPLPPFGRHNIDQGDPFYQLGGEPSRFNVTDTQVHALLPSIVGYKTWDRWAFAAGVFVPLGFGYEWEDKSIPGLDARFKSQGFMIAYNLSVAYRLNDRLALGGGVNMMDAQLKRSAEKDSAAYNSRFSADGRGHGWQGVIGLLAKLHKMASFGMTYKTGSDVMLDGTATATDSRFPLTIPGVGTLNNESTPVHQTLRNPAVYMAGFAFFPIQNLTLTTDWEGTDWRGTRTHLEVDQPGAILQNQDFDAGWRFTHRARLGGEYRWSYRLDRELAFRGGYTWDPATIPDSQTSLTNIVDTSRSLYTAGLGWRVGAWEVSAGLIYGTSSRTAENVEFKRIDRLVTAGLSYRV